jgi:hypothetical protein
MTTFEANPGVESARTGTLRRIGRNLVNAQRVELMLKFLLGVTFSGPMSSLQADFKAHVDKTSRKTMGLLISELAERVLLPGDPPAMLGGSDQLWMSSKVTIPISAESLNEWNKEWETIRNERNRLVHLMLASVDFEQPEQCSKLDVELDVQNQLFLEGIGFLRPIVIRTKEVIAEMARAELVVEVGKN